MAETTKRTNLNHPKAGTVLKVMPIVREKDINSIKKLLVNTPRDYAIFVLGINTNLRASDLVKLKVEQVKNLKPGDDLELVEQKTKKKRRLTFNKACYEAVGRLMAARKFKDEDYLFLGQRLHRNAQDQLVGHITPIYVNQLVKQWTNQINLIGQYGAHTLRKTWGYHQRVTFNTDLPTLMVCYNHSSQRQTLDYLCIQPQEIKDVFMNCL